MTNRVVASHRCLYRQRSFPHCFFLRPQLPSQRPAFTRASALDVPQPFAEALAQKVQPIPAEVVLHPFLPQQLDREVEPASASAVPQPTPTQLSATETDVQPCQEQPTSVSQELPGSPPEKDNIFDLIVLPYHKLLTSEFEPPRDNPEMLRKSLGTTHATEHMADQVDGQSGSVHYP